MEEVKTFCNINDVDLENMKINNSNKSNNNYEFINDILRNNIGNLIDDFLKTNHEQLITKYNGQMFVIMMIQAFKESSKQIGSKFDELIKIKDNLNGSTIKKS